MLKKQALSEARGSANERFRLRRIFVINLQKLNTSTNAKEAATIKERKIFIDETFRLQKDFSELSFRNELTPISAATYKEKLQQPSLSTNKAKRNKLFCTDQGKLKQKLRQKQKINKNFSTQIQRHLLNLHHDC